MQELQLPTSHEWTAQSRVYGKLTIGQFEPGFALTVGNAYRRVLMSAIHGAAPTWVKIENVLHEFSHSPGVVEDTLDIMMNLRKIVFALHVNRPKILRMRSACLESASTERRSGILVSSASPVQETNAVGMQRVTLLSPRMRNAGLVASHAV